MRQCPNSQNKYLTKSMGLRLVRGLAYLSVSIDSKPNTRTVYCIVLATQRPTRVNGGANGANGAAPGEISMADFLNSQKSV